MRIRDLPESMRPREKALATGVESLSDQELLALLIQKGVPNYSALDIAGSLLSTYRSFGTLSSLNPRVFEKEKGISKAKALEIGAVFEIARRAERQSVDESSMEPSDLYSRFRLSLSYSSTEKVILLCYDLKKHLLQEKVLFQGNEKAVSISEKTILSEALSAHASILILLHNHPSGASLPSKDDLTLTDALGKRAFELGMLLKDHVIIAGETYFSFRLNGLM